MAGSADLVQLVSTERLWGPALDLAVARDHPVYDTLFVALAAERGSKVITYDQKILRKFPEWAISAPEFLAGRAPAAPRR
jgi:predicted nucleic acid-binding protein